MNDYRAYGYLVETQDGFAVVDLPSRGDRSTGIMASPYYGDHLDRRAMYLNTTNAPPLSEARFWEAVTAAGTLDSEHGVLDDVADALAPYAVTMATEYGPNRAFPHALTVVGRGFTAHVWFDVGRPSDRYHCGPTWARWNNGTARQIGGAMVP